MIRICISGLGKTGREIAKAILEQEELRVRKSYELKRLYSIDNAILLPG